MTIINIQSDVFHQVKPHKLAYLEEAIKTGTRYAQYKFGTATVNESPKPKVIWAAHYLNFSNLEVYSLLKKATGIVENTEEYAAYLLERTFGDQKSRKYSTPPGTVRFYSQDLICFYNGKTWRKIKLETVQVPRT
jgi:hypothetical protein